MAVLTVGVFLWNVSSTQPHRPAITQQERSAIFQAVRQQLLGARVQPQDLPKRIISADAVGEQRYRIHMEMVQGEAWFEVWWDGGRWQVKGMNAPGAGN